MLDLIWMGEALFILIPDLYRKISVSVRRQPCVLVRLAPKIRSRDGHSVLLRFWTAIEDDYMLFLKGSLKCLYFNKDCFRFHDQIVKSCFSIFSFQHMDVDESVIALRNGVYRIGGHYKCESVIKCAKISSKLCPNFHLVLSYQFYLWYCSITYAEALDHYCIRRYHKPGRVRENLTQFTTKTSFQCLKLATDCTDF